MFNPETLKTYITTNSVPFRQNAISFIFTCPRCEKPDKLYIRKRDGRFVCWKCKESSGFKGRPEYALKEIYAKPLNEICKVLYGSEIPETLQPLDLTLDLSVDSDEFMALELESSSFNEVLIPSDFLDYHTDKFLPGFSYLTKRGIDLDLIDYYDIRYSAFDARVVFPIKINGTWIGWQARYIKPTKRVDLVRGNTIDIPKILTSNSIRGNASKVLMFQDNLVGVDHCVLAEGPVSAIKAHKCGGNVASMGKAVSLQQLKIIRRYSKKLYLALDPDAADDITRIVVDETLDLETYLLQPVPGKEDLGECSLDETFEQFKTAPRIRRGDLIISLGNKLGF